MALQTDAIIDVLRERGINPEESEPVELPDIGEAEEGEAIYATSIDEVFGGEDIFHPEDGRLWEEDGRLWEWWREIEEIITGSAQSGIHDLRSIRGDPPEPHCAWYCPIHFFGHAWGIYIRESCILSSAKDIARAVHWRAPPSSTPSAIARQLLRGAFYVFYLHEQFHHKVESLGFRLLISSGADRYRPYKRNVYRRSYNSVDCLEESLANAESYLRLSEGRYKKRLSKAMLDGLRSYLKTSFSLQPPAYAAAKHYLQKRRYRDGVYAIESQMLDGTLSPTTPAAHWAIAPDMITALMNISDDIYVVLPRGAHPIFKPTSIDPGATVSSNALVSALTKHHGYHLTTGGKGSHVKLTKPGAPPIIVPGNRPVVSPGVVKKALQAIGGYPISRLPDLVDGRLPQ